MAGGAGSSIGRGGMITKILAARRAAGSGASTVIAWGREPDALLRLARGEAIGTLLVAQTQKTQARKQWMADHLQLRGAVLVDDGAAAKVRDEGKSLLPMGMTAVEGDFSRGVMPCVMPAASSPRAGQLFQCRGAPVVPQALIRNCPAGLPRPKWCTATIWC
jgi:glutamate 5-kinase